VAVETASAEDGGKDDSKFEVSDPGARAEGFYYTCSIVTHTPVLIHERKAR
jgi:hypothetical protein